MRKSLLPVLLILIFVFTGKASEKREMRAVWIATVANIDWPASPDMKSADQRKSMQKMLDQLVENNINAIILQIRPTADAFYISGLEPWSYYLTGKQGREPRDFYDPLQFIIEEAHKRCIEVHAWMNPYRVLNDDRIGSLSSDHIYQTRKDLIVKYGGKYYFDPGLDDTRDFLIKVVDDVVGRYDIDAIHFDDYFYPYPVNGEEFPDEKTFRKHPRGFAHKADWRRNNVNLIIRELKETIKRNKPWVEFGISPFGVWRNQSSDPSGSATQAGIQNYDDLYADILLWLKEGSIDYVVPQLYWEIGKKVADYEVLIKWWSDNSFNKNLYIGLYASALEINKTPAWKKPNELARQLRMNKDYPKVSGAAFFSAKPFLKNLQGLNDSLKHDFYKHPAICPENNNIAGEASLQPQNARIIRDGKQALFIWDKVEETMGKKVSYYVVYAYKGGKVGDLNNPSYILTKTTDNYIDLVKHGKKLKGKHTLVVTSVNRYNKESQPTYAITRRL